MTKQNSSGVTRRELLVAGAAVIGASSLAACGATGEGVRATGQREGRAVKRIVIIGAGFGGLETASGLAGALGDGWEIVLIDKSDAFFIGFSKIDVLFGRRSQDEVSYRYADLRADRVRFVQDAVTAIDTAARTVTTAGAQLSFDYLVVALGADVAPQATPGFIESGGYEFYTMAGAERLAPVLDGFTRGTLVLGILGVPYKCPPAPYEVAYQIHDLLARKGVRDAVTLKVVIPGARPVPSPPVADALEGFLAERAIELVTNAAVREVDHANKKLVTAAGEVGYDLFVGVPKHVPPAVVVSSGLADTGFVPASPVNLETSVPGVYAIGDVATIPAGDKAVAKAGAFAEDAARTVVSDILLKEGLTDALVKFNAMGTCFFELGGGQLAKVNANFLGGPKPTMRVEGPLSDIADDKREFETSRRDRWFRVAPE